jgi:hypothetical protein
MKDSLKILIIFILFLCGCVILLISTKNSLDKSMDIIKQRTDSVVRSSFRDYFDSIRIEENKRDSVAVAKYSLYKEKIIKKTP